MILFYSQPVVLSHLVSAADLGSRMDSAHTEDLMSLLVHADEGLSSQAFFSGVWFDDITVLILSEVNLSLFLFPVKECKV